VKLASYIIDGTNAYGVVQGDQVITVNKHLGSRYPTLRSALESGVLDEIRRVATDAQPDHKLSDLLFLPVIANPPKILCAGLNYRSHVAETGREMPTKPSMFSRFTDTLLGHQGVMIRPSVSEQFDYEGELAVIIGRAGRHVPLERALEYVAGYTCFMDGSVRDFQKISITAGKNFPASGPLGPWMVTADEIPDPSKLTLATRLNGREVQRSTTDLLIYSVPTIISYVSDFTPLEPGDIIATGTPEGVGHKRTPPLWMKAGDVIEVEISGIGTLRNRVEDEPIIPN
jgi:2-keto-4-pentenoate hydratase/2-oxohepta-3-ene-1,7-dioic acid hydratase in catechol pathway